jgi:hypothetical protein
VVDDIGRALGVEYADDEELQGGARSRIAIATVGTGSVVEGRLSTTKK